MGSMARQPPGDERLPGPEPVHFDPHCGSRGEQPNPRMESVDRAVIDEIAKWTAESEDTLAGGARVWDSLNRIGQPPTDYVARKLGSGTPLTWSRYLPRSSSSKPSNIRILTRGPQHSGQGRGRRPSPWGQSVGFPSGGTRSCVLFQTTGRRSISSDHSGRAGLEAIRDRIGGREREGVEDQGEQPVVRSALSGAILASDSADSPSPVTPC